MSWSFLLDRGLFETWWRYPYAVTVMAELRPDQVAATIDDLQGSCERLQLEQLPQLHFFRMFVLDAETDLRGRPLPARLVISAVIEDGLSDFFRQLVQRGGPLLNRLLARCDGFPQTTRDEDVVAWLKRHADWPQTLHVGTLRDRLQDIRDEHGLRIAINEFVDQRQAAGDWTDGDVVAIHRDIQQHVRSIDNLPQAPRPAAWGLRVLEFLDLLRMLIMLAALPTLLAVLYVYLCWPSWWHVLWLAPLIGLLLAGLALLAVRCYELLEGDFVVHSDPQRVADLIEDEDFGIQNQFTMLTPVRDSHFRRLGLRLILWLANGVSKHWYRRGKLVGIDTIHAARFHLLDGGRRLLFMSDFDGGWERYLFDFLGVGSFAVVPIWTNLHGCPKTRFLRFPTRGFAQRFLPFTRANQRHTHLWYSAIDYVTVSEIKRNAQVRAGLFGNPSRATIERWLKLL